MRIDNNDEFTLTLCREEMLQVLAALNWCADSLASMPAALVPDLDVLQALRDRREDVRAVLDGVPRRPDPDPRDIPF